VEVPNVTGVARYHSDVPVKNYYPSRRKLSNCRPSYKTTVPSLMDYPELGPWWGWVGLGELSSRLNTGFYMLSCYLNW